MSMFALGRLLLVFIFALVQIPGQAHFLKVAVAMSPTIKSTLSPQQGLWT